MALKQMKEQNGSIVLETLMVLPIFMALFLALSFLLSVAQTKAALRDAVDEAVKTAAAYAYPVDLLVSAYRDHPANQQVQSAINRFLPDEIKRMLEWNYGREHNEIFQLTIFEGEQVKPFEGWLKRAVLFYSDQTVSGRSRLKEDHLSIRSVTLPNFLDEDGSYFGMTAIYTIPIPVPFIRGEITLTESSYERCWVGNK